MSSNNTVIIYNILDMDYNEMMCGKSNQQFINVILNIYTI